MNTELTPTLTPATEEEIQRMIVGLQNEFESNVKRFKLQSNQKDRYEDLMKRKSAEKWKPEKVAQMVRRLTRINEEIENTELNLERVKGSLSQHGIEIDVVQRR